MLFIGPNDENLVTRALRPAQTTTCFSRCAPLNWWPGYERCFGAPPIGRSSTSPEERVLHAGDVRLDPESHEVTLRSARVHLPLREFELLRLLLENAGIVLPRATLMNRFGARLQRSDSTSLEVHVRRLRSKLEDDPADPKRIVTVRGIGYRYQAER